MKFYDELITFGGGGGGSRCLVMDLWIMFADELEMHVIVSTHVATHPSAVHSNSVYCIVVVL